MQDTHILTCINSPYASYEYRINISAAGNNKVRMKILEVLELARRAKLKAKHFLKTKVKLVHVIRFSRKTNYRNLGPVYMEVGSP